MRFLPGVPLARRPCPRILGAPGGSGNQGTPGTVEATTVASSEHGTMTGATLSEMYARILASNFEPEPAPTF